MRRTRLAFQEALLALLAEKPFEELTVREIAARAEVGYATFFRHYDDLDTLLADVASGEIAALLERTLPVFDTADTLASCEALCDWVAARRDLWRRLLTGGAAARVREEFIRQAFTLVPRHAHVKSPKVPPDLAVVFATSAVLDILAWWLRTEDAIPTCEIASYLNRLAIEPVI